MRRNICVALSLTCVLGASQVSATVRILDTTPEISALIAKGTAHEEKKQYDQAIFDFSEALLLKPTPLVAAELYGLRGSEHVFKGDFESAKADAEEAIRLAPHYFRGYQTRARLFGAETKFDRAMTEINRAIQLEPNLGTLYMDRGNLMSSEGKQARAIAEYDKAIKLNPRGSSYYIGRGVAYQEMGRNEAALADYHQAILLNPAAVESYHNRATINFARKDYPRVIADLDRYIQLIPNDGAVYAFRARAFIAQRNYRRAGADLREAIDLAPHDAHTLNTLAWLRATCPDDSERDGKAAVDAATQACALTKWKDNNHLDTLAAAYAEAGDFDRAVNFEIRALSGFSGQKRKDAEARLALYREHKPYHETRATPAPSPTPSP